MFRIFLPIPTFLILPLLTFAGPRTALAGEIPWPNGGFEESESGPSWSLLRGADGGIVGGGKARTGSHWFETEGGGFTGTLPLAGEGYITLGGYFRAKSPGETICLSAPGLKTPSARPTLSAARIENATYTLVAVTGLFREHLLGRVRMDAFNKDGTAVEADDFFAWDNRIRNPTFDQDLEGWTSSGGIQIVQGEPQDRCARLDPGASLSQRLAAAPYAEVLYGCRVRSPTGKGVAQMTLSYFDPIGEPVLESSVTVSAGSNWSPIHLRAILPATATWGVMQVRTESPVSIEVDSFEHVCLSTPHCCFSPNGDGVYDTLPVSVWIDREATAEISVVDSIGDKVATLMSVRLEGGRFWDGLWDGLDGSGNPVPSGDYDLVLKVQPAEGAAYSLPRRIRLAHQPTAVAQTSRFHLDFFPRGFWMNVHDSFSGEGNPSLEGAVEEEYDLLFSRMKECRANAAVPAVLDLQYSAVRRSAERRRVHQIPSLFKPELNLRYADPLEESAIWKGYSEAIEPWLGSSFFLGTYPLDEPTSELLGRARSATRILSTLAPGAPAFFSLTDFPLLGEFLDSVNPPAVLFHDYPCIEGEERADLERFVHNLEWARREALDRGLPFWAVLQAFSEEGRHRTPTPTEFRAMAGIALALGSKGVFSFLFNSSRWSPVEGLLDRNFEPRPLLEEVARVYKWIEENEDLLMRLDLVQDCATVSRPGYVRTLADMAGSVYFFAVNTDPVLAAELELTPLEGFSVPELRISLGPGDFVLLKGTGSLPDKREPPNLAKDTVDSLVSRFKFGAKAILEPVRGDFDWKQVGRVYGQE